MRNEKFFRGAMKSLLAVTLLFGTLSVPVAGQGDNFHWIDEFVSEPQLRGAGIAIHVVDGLSGNTLVDFNADLLLAPASTLKVFTTASALEILGPAYCFSTVLGYRGDILKGRLKGTIIVKGGGDPTLGSVWFPDRPSADSVFTRWAAKLKAAGIQKVEGNLEIDISGYEEFDLPGSWAWEDVGNYYGAAPAAVSLYDNMVRLFLDSPRDPGLLARLVSSWPYIPGINWKNEVLTSVVNRDLAYVYGSPWGETRYIRGTIPANRKNFEVKAAMPDPPLNFGRCLKSALAGNGIILSGDITISATPSGFVSLDTLVSPDLAAIIQRVNHESVNLFAEQLVMQTGLETVGKGSVRTGLKAMEDFWQSHGWSQPFFLEDGSGLSRYNAIPARLLTFVLNRMRSSPVAGYFQQSLPIAGKGTLASFPVSHFPGESLRCKSGSMERVRGYAGYLTCDSGRSVDFAVLVNNFPCSQQEVLKKIQALLLKFKREL